MTTPTLRFRLIQMPVRPGRPDDNLRTMLDAVARARADHVDVVVFPEMAIPGYLLADEWERDAFLRECESATEALIDASQGITLIFGNVAVDRERRNEDGRPRKYNAMFVADNGKLAGPPDAPYPFVIKTLMPNYRQFDDSRHFYDLRKLAAERNRPLKSLIRPIPVRGALLGCMLCEDAWDPDYGLSPMQCLADQGAQIFINISASPFTLNKDHKRKRLMNAAARRYARPLVYCNLVGIQNNGKTIYTFDGASCIYDGHGHQVALSPPFRAAELTQSISLDAHSFGTPVVPAENTTADMLEALEFGTRAFLEQLGVKQVVVGISGGVDSALAAALMARCISPRNLVLLTMPGPFNSPTTIRLARRLAASLDAWFAEVPITESVELTRRQLDGLTLQRPGDAAGRTLTLTDFMMENIQARDRSARLLAAVASACGGVFTCNANKSELTVGYGTLYGDLGGFLAPLGDLWKTEVWRLADTMNADIFGGEIIPNDTIRLTPSAELSPAQNVDQGQGDPLFYPYHDLVFKAWVETWNRISPEDMLAWRRDGQLEEHLGYAGAIDAIFPDMKAFVDDLERWWTLYQGMGLAKRIQAPPILAIKRRAFGFDHRESQIGPRFSRRYQALKHELLGDTA